MNILIFLQLLYGFSPSPPLELCKTWKEQYKSEMGWKSSYKYTRFTKDWKLEFIDAEGTIHKQFDFKINAENEIILNDGKVFGKIVHLNSNALKIEKVTSYEKGGKVIPQTFEFNYSLKQETKKQNIKTSILEKLTSGKWVGEFKNAHRTLLIEIQTSSNPDSPLELIFKGSGSKKPLDLIAKTNLIDYEGTYMLAYQMPQFPGHVEYMFIIEINEEEMLLDVKLTGKEENMKLKFVN